MDLILDLHTNNVDNLQINQPNKYINILSYSVGYIIYINGLSWIKHKKEIGKILKKLYFNLKNIKIKNNIQFHLIKILTNKHFRSELIINSYYYNDHPYKNIVFKRNEICSIIINSILFEFDGSKYNLVLKIPMEEDHPWGRGTLHSEEIDFNNFIEVNDNSSLSEDIDDEFTVLPAKILGNVEKKSGIFGIFHYRYLELDLVKGLIKRYKKPDDYFKGKIKESIKIETLTSLKKLVKPPNSDYYTFEIQFINRRNKTITQLYRVRHIGARAKWFDSIRLIWQNLVRGVPIPPISKEKLSFIDDNLGIIQDFKKNKNKEKEKNTPKVSIKNFKILNILGFGAFSTVYKVRHLLSKKIYAMKVMDKNILIKNKHLHYVLTEYSILKKVGNFPFILTLHFAFQTTNYLYMITDYCSDGDTTRATNIKNIRVLIAELILSIEHLHKKDIIYRDLKPENILMCDDGHMKLCDFNLSKENVKDGERALSFCGSPMYLSPDMLGKEGIDKSADIYSIGLLIYEYFAGRPCFYTLNPKKLYEDILNNNVNFDVSSIPPKAKDLLKKILIKDTQKRLNFDQIKAHPFFQGLNWDDVLHKKYGKITLSKLKKTEEINEEKSKDARFCNITVRDIKKDYKRHLKQMVKHFYFVGEDIIKNHETDEFQVFKNKNYIEKNTSNHNDLNENNNNLNENLKIGNLTNEIYSINDNQ